MRRDFPQNTAASDVISDVVHTQTLTEFYSPESLQSPAETTVAPFQENKPEEESKQNY